uniref:Uncharacterized protein n=1 Tax=Elaeophora elaphi TaxID=1147741 RepID=A0A0R3RS63_9BILA
MEYNSHENHLHARMFFDVKLLSDTHICIKIIEFLVLRCTSVIPATKSAHNKIITKTIAEIAAVRNQLTVLLLRACIQQSTSVSLAAQTTATAAATSLIV